MSNLTGYVMLMVIDSEGNIRLFGSPPNTGDHITAVDEIIEINGSNFITPSFFSVLQNIDESIKSKNLLKIRVKRGKHSSACSKIPDYKQGVVFGIESSGQSRLNRLYENGYVEKIQHYDMPKDVRQLLVDLPLYVSDFIKSALNSSDKSARRPSRDLSTLSLCHISSDSTFKSGNKLVRRLSSKLTNSGRFDWKLTSLLEKMAAAAPIPHQRYKLNNGFNGILPPDENTHEMAVDCPPAYVAAHPPMSGRSTPRDALNVPPPTPMDGSVVGGQAIKTSKDLQNVAEKAADISQPEMNFSRINRMRESAKRQKELRHRDQRVRQQMAAADGAKKIQSLQHLTPEQELQARKVGVENPTFVRDSYIDDGSGAMGSRTSVPGIEEMFLSISQINQKIDDESLLGEINFLKTLIQDENFQEALELHKTLAVNKAAQQSSEHTQPIVADLQNVVTDVQEQFLYSQLQPSNELRSILSKPHLKGLLVAHDGSANLLEPPSSSNPYANINVHNAEDEEIIRRVSQYTNKAVRVVRINKTTEVFGATVRCEEDGRVTIGRIISGGVAERGNLFHEGDELIEVNGKSMRGLEVNEVGDAIAAMDGTMVFVLASPSKQVNGFSGSQPYEVVKHVRALYDYDAFDDPYIPCRELGLSFQKGDVLRIMSTDDPDWWQAYRDEDDDTHLTLAGLIPSQEFQHKREAIRISMAKESNAPESKKSLLCVRKKKHKKRAMTIYDENEEDEPVQTYEEMALYHQPETRKRPIVLIGPPNVGRHELRQRLVDNDKDRFGTPVPVTTREPLEGEQAGVDYHYITDEEFQTISDSGGFVEYGQYQKTLYGTTVDAVRDVIDKHKICVLNLHAESLSTLCASDLKPYIVFIGPPPLERLRQNMEKERRQIREDELRKIIEDARSIERKYAHYFDDTIRNIDLNRSYAELLRLINKLDTEPQWVPAAWLDNGGPL